MPDLITTALPATPYVFDLDGGRPCLDFANTAGSSSGEHLRAYADLVAFAAQSHLLAPQTIAWLLAKAERSPSAAADTLAAARVLRLAIRRIFSAVASGARPADTDLDLLNAHLAASLAHARILPAPTDTADGDVLGTPPAPTDSPDAYVWGWAGIDLTSPLWPVVRSAADLLTSASERRLVRECGAGDCWWLFMDTTKNRSRQWCSMTSCGNRQKARRHYQRLKATRATDPSPSTSAAAPRAPRRTRRTSTGPVAPVADA
jgi:predicted RNA-binding Zn ribbon-like protein